MSGLVSHPLRQGVQGTPKFVPGLCGQKYAEADFRSIAHTNYLNWDEARP